MSGSSELFLCQFVILVVDSTDLGRMSLTRDELHKMVQHPELNKASILVFANKQVTIRCLAGTVKPNSLPFLTILGCNRHNILV
jgi:hypothetical protein